MTGLVVTSASATPELLPRFERVEIAGDHRPDLDRLTAPGAAGNAAGATPFAGLSGNASPSSHDDAAPDRGSGPVSQVPEGPAAIARWDGVELYAQGETTELVGFHESNNPEALPLDASRPVAKTHHPAAEVPTTGESDGQLVVLPTRHRPSGAMTAIDLAVQPDEQVVAPVSGIVEQVSTYQLYGEPDFKIWIRPADNPDAQVSVIHINEPMVEVGDTVTGGETPIAVSARQLAFESQVDRFTDAHRGTRTPHVHIEMREATEPPPKVAGRPDRSDRSDRSDRAARAEAQDRSDRGRRGDSPGAEHSRRGAERDGGPRR